MLIDPAKFSQAYDALAPYRDQLDSEIGGWASEYWRVQRGRYELLLDYVTNHVRLQPNDRILDIGVFPGYFTFSLAAMGLDISALDLAPERMLDFARTQGVQVSSCNIDSEPFPFDDCSFDVVFFNAVIEHLRVNPIQTMREIHRILKPGGRALVQTPNLGYWVCRVKVLFGGSFDESPTSAYRKLEELGHPGHIRVYQMDELIEMVKFVGFDVGHRGWGHFQKRMPGRPRAVLDRLFGIIPSMRRQLFVTAVRPAD